MDYLRKMLKFLRKDYNTSAKKFYVKYGSIFVAFAIVSVLVDIFVPFGAGWNLVRSVIIVPLGFSLFALCYATSLLLHYMKGADESWVPYRERFSPMWRVRISVIIFAVAIVFTYSIPRVYIYTLLSSFMVTIVLSLVTFSRKTSLEIKRGYLGLPDARDIDYDRKVQKAQVQRKKMLSKKEATKNAKKEKKRSRKFKYLKVGKD